MLDITEQIAHHVSISKLAQSLTEIDLEQRILAFQLFGEGLAIAVINYLPLTEQITLLQAIDAVELIRVLEMMDASDRSRLMASLPDEVTAKLMTKLKAEFQRNLHLLFHK